MMKSVEENFSLVFECQQDYESPSPNIFLLASEGSGSLGLVLLWILVVFQ